MISYVHNGFLFTICHLLFAIIIKMEFWSKWPQQFIIEIQVIIIYDYRQLFACPLYSILFHMVCPSMGEFAYLSVELQIAYTQLIPLGNSLAKKKSRSQTCWVFWIQQEVSMTHINTSILTYSSFIVSTNTFFRCYWVLSMKDDWNDKKETKQQWNQEHWY